MVDRANAGSQIGEELLCCAQDLFTRWYRVRDGTLKRSTFRQYMGIVRSMVREQPQAGTACGCAKTAGTCRELLAVEPAPRTFVRVEGIGPDQQRGGAGAAACGSVAQGQSRDGQ